MTDKELVLVVRYGVLEFEAPAIEIRLVKDAPALPRTYPR